MKLGVAVLRVSDAEIAASETDCRKMLSSSEAENEHIKDPLQQKPVDRLYTMSVMMMIRLLTVIFIKSMDHSMISDRVVDLVLLFSGFRFTCIG